MNIKCTFSNGKASNQEAFLGHLLCSRKAMKAKKAQVLPEKKKQENPEGDLNHFLAHMGLR